MAQPPPPVPPFDHIFIVIMENHGYGEIIGSPDAPFINQLAARYGVATNYVSVAHPSLPNYLALTGGDTFGITTDCTDCFQQAPNLVVDRIAPSGRTWRAYMESMPAPGYLGDAYPYMQKHDPFVYYDDLRTDPAQLANVVPFSQLAADLATAATTPAFGWITPNMLHDMHDGTVAQGDAWLAGQVPVLARLPAWTQQRSLLVITWDEDDNAPGNQVATLVIATRRAGRIPVRCGLQPLLAAADHRTRLRPGPADRQRRRRHRHERLLRNRLTAKHNSKEDRAACGMTARSPHPSRRAYICRQMQLCCYGDGGEQLAVYSGPAVDVSFDTADFAKAGGQWIADYFGGKWVQLAQDVAGR